MLLCEARFSELHDVAALPYIDELLEYRVKNMFEVTNTHDNPLVRSMGQLYQWRNVFQGICLSTDQQVPP